MGGSQELDAKVLPGEDPALYRQAMDTVTEVLDPSRAVVSNVIVLAGTYADQVIDSLPEDDREILRAGLVGALVSFLVDALVPRVPAHE